MLFVLGRLDFLRKYIMSPFKFIAFLLALFCLQSCAEEKEAEVLDSEVQEDTLIVVGRNLYEVEDQGPQYAVDQAFSQGDFDPGDIPPIIEKQLDGASFIKGAYWKDGNGDNYLGIYKEVDRDKDLTQLRAFHAVNLGGDKFRILKMLNDGIANCEFDLILDLIPASLTITDIDSNRYAEVIFVYQMGCISDVSPLQAKLMVLENGNKYAIRGNTSLSASDDQKAQIDSLLNQAPIAIQTYAQAQWERFTDTTVYYWR